MAQTPDHIEQFNQTSSLEVASETVRKAYHPPHLHHYGHVREVTKTSNVGPGFDGGGFPNGYTS